VTVATVCGGSLVLALAGLIEGRRAVTHHLGMDTLDATGAIPVRARVVDDGDLVTAGGVTSGLDLGLYLLERKCQNSVQSRKKSGASDEKWGSRRFGVPS